MHRVVATDFMDGTPVKNGRRWALVLSALLLAWVAYASTPFISLGLLIQSAKNGDEAAVSSAIDFPKLRRSIARQLVADQAAKRTLQSGERQLALSIGTASVSAWLQDVVTPQSIAVLLSGQPLSFETEGQKTSILAPKVGELSMSQAFSVWLSSGFRGPVNYIVVFPAEADAERFSMELGLVGFRWRMVGVDLSPDLRKRLSEKVFEIANSKGPLPPAR